MDNDLISREALKKALNTELKDHLLYLPFAFKELIENAPTVEPQKVLVANVTFDKDQLEQLVRDRVIEPIKNGELVLQTDTRPQGEWLRTTHDIKGEHPQTACWYKCSVCNKDNPVNIMFKYCPECGADMRGGEDNR